MLQRSCKIQLYFRSVQGDTIFFFYGVNWESCGLIISLGDGINKPLIMMIT